MWDNNHKTSFLQNEIDLSLQLGGPNQTLACFPCSLTFEAHKSIRTPHVITSYRPLSIMHKLRRRHLVRCTSQNADKVHEHV